MPRHFLRFREVVVGIRLNIGDLHWTALQQCATCRGSPSGPDRGALPQLQAAGRSIVGGSGSAAFAVVTEDHAVFGTANANGILEQRFEHALEVERRPADGLEDLGRGGLLSE